MYTCIVGVRFLILIINLFIIINYPGAGGGTPQQPVTSVNKRSAIWPSVIFSQSANRNSAAGKVQVSIIMYTVHVASII